MSNEKRRKYYDKHGCMEGEEDNLNMDDLFKDMFKGGMSFQFEDFFDDFSDLLGGSKAESKRMDKMFREMGKGYRQKPKGRARPAKGGKGGGAKGMVGMGMEDMMMSMMMESMMSDMMGGMGGGKPKGGNKGSKNNKK